ncbi:MAG: AraC family transcriptional regulator [Verrucomicrobia bacterium]|nr:AraC family transcriptional regulator [Verrucomicrobiota bacterium]
MSANALTQREKARALRFQTEFLDRIGGGLQLSALFAHLPMVAFLAKDEQSRFVCANAPTLKIFNLGHEWEMLGKTDADFFSRPLAESFVEEDRRVMTSGETRTYYAQMVPDIAGPLNWYVVTVAPLRDARDRICGVAIVLYDQHEIGGVAQPFSQLEPALRHLHTRFREAITTAELAALCHLSERQFTRVFRRLLGESPMRYLIRQRLHAARHDLIANDRPAGAIALDLGFYDQSAFTRAFHAATGMTPAAYRSRHLHEPAATEAG